VRILVVNPNTTSAMTEDMRRAAERYARPGTEVVAVEPTWGPESIEGFFEGFLSAAAVLERLATLELDVDAVVMAGFGEPGREGARELLDVPVLDITECAAQMACVVAHRFSVVTTLARTIPQIEESLAGAGLLGRCASVRATGLGVLDLEQDPQRTTRRLAEEARSAIEQDRADAIVLGCGGLGGFDKELQQQLGVPVIDGIVAAVKLAEGLHDYGLATSSAGPYARPRPKRIAGWPRPVADEPNVAAGLGEGSGHRDTTLT
jgi:allantoin racemase